MNPRPKPEPLDDRAHPAGRRRAEVRRGGRPRDRRHRRGPARASSARSAATPRPRQTSCWRRCSRTACSATPRGQDELCPCKTSTARGRRAACCWSRSSRWPPIRRTACARASRPPRRRDEGRRLFDYFVGQARTKHPVVETGEFGADMQVSLVNDGPVTFWLQTNG